MFPGKRLQRRCISNLNIKKIPPEEDVMLSAKLLLCASTLLLADPWKTDWDWTCPAPETDVQVIDGVELAAIEANIVKYTNEERAKRGLPALQVCENLMDTAREHAAWMTRNHSMVHTSRPVAENIAMGQPHSSDAVRAWMNSSGHRANILNPRHRRIGVAAFRTARGTIFWCQQFRH